MKRSKWKGVYATPKDYHSQVPSLTRISRNSSIIPKFMEQTFKVHNGKLFKDIKISKEMLGHKFGEFCRTRVAFEYKKKKKKNK
jgi:ribosomal protein S19